MSFYRDGDKVTATFSDGRKITGYYKDGEIVDEDAKAEIYDMAGRRLQNAHKGIYIINGKKVIK